MLPPKKVMLVLVYMPIFCFPKGLFLLQQTGAIAECVAYMHSRYTKKLQVRRYLVFTSSSLHAVFRSANARSSVMASWSRKSLPPRPALRVKACSFALIVVFSEQPVFSLKIPLNAVL